MVAWYYFSLIPVLCLISGALLTRFFQPSHHLTSITQHFAAGVVFAAVAKELIPQLGADSDVLALILGFLLGISSMLLIKHFTDVPHGDNDSRFSWGMIAAVAVDLFVDGVLIGIAFIVGEQGGLLVAIALAIEVFFLGLSTFASIRKAQLSLLQTILTLITFSALIPLGSLLGFGVLHILPVYYTTAFLAFGVAALLYLVTEELLLEAHETEDSNMATLSFFIGFLIILVIENLAG